MGARPVLKVQRTAAARHWVAPLACSCLPICGLWELLPVTSGHGPLSRPATATRVPVKRHRPGLLSPSLPPNIALLLPYHDHLRSSHFYLRPPHLLFLHLIYSQSLSSSPPQLDSTLSSLNPFDLVHHDPSTTVHVLTSSHSTLIAPIPPPPTLPRICHCGFS